VTRGKSKRDPYKLYAQEFRLLQHILESDRAVTHIRCDSKSSGIALRHRLYKARSADRETSPTFDSVFDPIRISAPTLGVNGWYMRATIVDEDELLALIDKEEPT
jgi:hypothetical protein